MLSLVSSARSDHPLDDEKARRALLDELQDLNPLAGLTEISGHLDMINVAENLRPARALDIITFLERAARPLHARLTHDYVTADPRTTKFHQRRIFGAVHSYWIELAASYRRCLGQWQSGALGAGAIKPFLSAVIAGAMRACAQQLKWSLLCRSPVDVRLWREIAELYRMDRALQSPRVPANQPSAMPPFDHELLHALMLAVSSTDGLPPVQVHLAQEVIGRLAGEFRMVQQATPGCFHVLDLSGRHAPMRPGCRVEPREDLRFFGPASAVASIEEMLRFIEQHRVLPPSLNGVHSADIRLVQETLRHLARSWSPVAQSRRHKRRRHKERVTVIHEFDEVLAGVAGLFLESPYVSNDEGWFVENVSDKGFGAMVPPGQAMWAKPGSLVGIRRADGAAWGAGVVRRIAVDAHDNRHVGIELLASGGAAVTIRPADPELAVSNISPEGELCVLLGEGPAHRSDVSLLLRADTVCAQEDLAMQAYDQRYLLRPLGIIEQGEDFEVARYRVLRQERS